MFRVRTLIKLTLLLVLILPFAAQAQFTFTTNADNTLTITGFTGTNGNVIIPDTINGRRVASIEGYFPYYFPYFVTNITIPWSVTNIGNGVFAFNSFLTAITVDGLNAYYSSSNGILFDKFQTLLVQAPAGISGSYMIPTSVTNIANSAFEGCNLLTNITIGTNVVRIGDNAFESCAGLTSVVIPDSVSSIGNSSFYNCGSLGSVLIPKNVTQIGSAAFAYCVGLSNIVVDGQNIFYSSSDGFLFDKPQITLIQAPAGIVGNYIIPPSVGTIESGAFQSCSELSSVSISDSVTNIGTYSFLYCGSLTNVTFGTNINSIGDRAFFSCSGLTVISIPNSVTGIGNSAFGYCGNLTNLVIGTNVTGIGDYAFQGCTKLTSVVIPDSVANIGVSAFDGCSSLTAIAVGSQNLFYSSSSGVLFDKPQHTLIQAPASFWGSFSIPSSVTSVGAGAFQNCAYLTDVNIPGNVTNIGDSAFAGCGNLVAITVSGQNLFYSSTNGILFNKLQTTLLQFPGGIGGNYVISNNVTCIGITAFSGCSNLTSITIPSSVTIVGNSAFQGCLRAAVHFQGNSPNINSHGLQGIGIYLMNRYSPNVEAVYYLPGTTGWGSSFEGLPAYLWVPPYVCSPSSNSITINGFIGSGIAIVIPKMINGLPVTTIGDGAFDNSASLDLTNLTIGPNVTSIGSYAFAACTSLNSITIPSSVTNIGSGAFAFCDNLASVYFQGDAPSVNSSVFFQWSYPYFPIFIYPGNASSFTPPLPTTIYYLPGTQGWSNSFAGCSSVLWNPQAQMNGAILGGPSNRFGFNIAGNSNWVVVVEASTDLKNWQPVSTNALTGGSATFSDPQWTNYPGRFYRLRSP